MRFHIPACLPSPAARTHPAGRIIQRGFLSRLESLNIVHCPALSSSPLFLDSLKARLLFCPLLCICALPGSSLRVSIEGSLIETRSYCRAFTS